MNKVLYTFLLFLRPIQSFLKQLNVFTDSIYFRSELLFKNLKLSCNNKISPPRSESDSDKRCGDDHAATFCCKSLVKDLKPLIKNLKILLGGNLLRGSFIYLFQLLCHYIGKLLLHSSFLKTLRESKSVHSEECIHALVICSSSHVSKNLSKNIEFFFPRFILRFLQRFLPKSLTMGLRFWQFLKLPAGTALLKVFRIPVYAITFIAFSLISIISTTSPSYAVNCTGRMFNPITDVCWDCIFPISIGPVPLGTYPNRRDTDNFPSPVCVCPKAGVPTPGVAIGFFEPIRLVDVTKKPFCMVSLGGKQLIPEGASRMGMGTSQADDATWHVHWYINPVISILNLVMDATCTEATSFDVAYMTELDPLFHDDMMSFIINPEAVLFANPIAQASCAADCVASTTYRPLDILFWCAGCQGSLYPFTGNLKARTNSIQETSMVTEKFIAKLHRQMILPNTSGPESICMPLPAPIIKKSQYRLQTTFPVVGVGPLGCNAFGKTTFDHESFKEIPVRGEDFGYLVWRKRNCCAL